VANLPPPVPRKTSSSVGSCSVISCWSPRHSMGVP
jgi:hypothetical protein